MEELRFDGLGGPNTLLVARPSGPPRARVMVAPALGLRATYYRDVAAALAGAGLEVAVVEWPGHGSSPIRPSRQHDWGYAELRAHLAAARRAWSRDAPVVWLGHSIGGQVALMDAGQHPAAVRGVVLVASGTPWRGAWRGRMRHAITLGTYVFPVVGALLGRHPGERLGFGGTEARRLMREWAHLARTGAYPAPEAAALAACTAPVLAVRIDGDDWAPEAAVEHGLAKLGGARVERVVWRGLPPANVHNRWPKLGAPSLDALEAFLAALPAAGRVE